MFEVKFLEVQYFKVQPNTSPEPTYTELKVSLFNQFLNCCSNFCFFSLLKHTFYVGLRERFYSINQNRPKRELNFSSISFIKLSISLYTEFSKLSLG